MNNKIKLTIGIPSVPNRVRMHLEPLYSRLMSQIGDIKDIEVLTILDNKVMSIGRKRSCLFHIAQGKYTCIIDDDDDVTPDFVETMRNTITDNLDVDVICYNQDANIEGKSWLVRTSLKHNRQFPFDQFTTDESGNAIPCNRPPWHWCAWKTDLAKTIPFGDTNWQEDSFFVMQALSKAKTEIVLDKVLCKYRWSSSVSQAPFQQIKFDEIKKVTL
jgi:hypothetical protein